MGSASRWLRSLENLSLLDLKPEEKVEKEKWKRKNLAFRVFHVERATHPLKTNQKNVTVRIEFS